MPLLLYALSVSEADGLSVMSTHEGAVSSHGGLVLVDSPDALDSIFKKLDSIFICGK